MDEAPRYRYWSGTVTLPASGAATPVCAVGPGGCTVLAAATGNAGVLLGGPDLTAGTGFPLPMGGPLFVAGTSPLPPPVVGAPPEPVPVLYALATGGKAVALSWLGGQPPPP